MAESTVDAAGPNLNLSPEEKRIYGQLFRAADTDSVGVVTGDVAVKFFEKTRLDSRVLGEIWQLADQENRGFLTPAGFSIVLRLIGHAQAGREPTQEIALQQGPIPRFDGFNPTPAAPPAAQPLSAQGTGGTPIRIPPLTPEKVSQYAGLFERQNLQGGNLLPGDQAKNIFEKSGLPNELLGRIWQLADTEQRGALVQTEFVIAMHLLTSLKTGQLRGLPNVLPAALYEAATRRVSAPRQSPTATGPPLSAIPRQLSGQAPLRQASPLGRAPLTAQGTGLQPQTTGSDWAITPADKARFDVLYADLDKTNKGFITGEEAVPFLSQSSLSEDALAQIWDLADINSQGHLTRDTFAVAMYLIRQQRSRRDGSNTLPTSLPPNLIPPSLRAQARPPTAVASPFDAPEPPKPQPPPAPKSALDDLFGLDAAPSAPVQAPMGTGGSVTRDPFANASPIAPASPVRASPTGSQFKPFIPSSSFGRSLAPQDTGSSSSPKPAVDDLLGDNDPEISKKLTNETAELANLSNQVGSLSTQMQQVQGQRAVTQKEFNQTSQQKKNFEDRLAQLRTLYEKEAKEVAELKDQLQKSRSEIQKLMTETATIDGNYREIQTQHQQLTAALQADQHENQSLKQKISAVNAEIAQLKPQVEKLKSDARQQKGLVAINKKQLSTVEGERDKLKTEVEDLTKSNEEFARSISTSSPVSPPAQVASPAPSTSSGNNPFFKRTGSTDIMGAFSSPPPKSYNDKSFDDIFGGFATGSASSTPPPPTSFKQQNTGTSTASAGSFATPAGSTPTTVTRGANLGVAEPPPPPVSRQITSSFLPFGDMSESLTSSRQASPPLSRVGETAPAVLATDAKPLEPAATGASTTSTHDDASHTAPNEDVGSPTSNGSIPGAFPEETPKAEAGAATPSFAGNRDSEVFESLKKEPVNTKDDFDSAFASFGSSSKTQDKTKDTNNAFSTFDSEFPPISELERDDDSDSASEGNGFDDDFAPTSPSAKKTDGKGTPKAPASPVATTKVANVANVPAAEGASSASQPSNDLSSPFPQASAAPTNAASTLQSEDPFAPASDFAPAPTTVTNTAPVASKTAFDDLDDEFEGLEDAKEGSADDDFATISRSNLDDFNPVFDSSPPPSQPKSDSNASNAFGIDSSYDFGAVSSSSGAPSQPASGTAPAASTTTGTKAADNHDWDSIFADLDKPGTLETTEAEAPKSPDQSLSPDRPSLQSTGRALTQEGVHDDPILKNLTGMGYSRTDALNALEKYDYNLERAANYLASQS